MRSSEITHPGPTLPRVLYWAGRLWMRLFGWDVEGEPPQTARAVLIASPHTSNWDLPHMLAASFVFRLRISWLGKHTLFRPPFGWLMRWIGGLPIDRRASHGFVEQAARALRDSERLILAVPPSGTRSRAEHWKSGFYWIAHTAQVPVICGYLDYSRKRACLGQTFVPSGDVAADMEAVRAIYASVRGRFPELETPVRLKEEASSTPEEGVRAQSSSPTPPLAHEDAGGRPPRGD